MSSVPLEGLSATAHDWIDIQGHICGLFNDLEEQYRVILPFIKEGLARGERTIQTIGPGRRDDHLKRLAESGVDVDSAISTGQLIVLDWHEVFVQNSLFDDMEIVSLFRQMCDNGRESGFHRTRFVCETQYQKGHKTTEQILIYEAIFQKFSFIAPTENDIIICAYHVKEWDAELLINVLRTHPLVILGGHLHENPFFQAPDEILAHWEASCC